MKVDAPPAARGKNRVTQPIHSGDSHSSLPLAQGILKESSRRAGVRAAAGIGSATLFWGAVLFWGVVLGGGPVQPGWQPPAKNSRAAAALARRSTQAMASRFQLVRAVWTALAAVGIFAAPTQVRIDASCLQSVNPLAARKASCCCRIQCSCENCSSEPVPARPVPAAPASTSHPGSSVKIAPKLLDAPLDAGGPSLAQGAGQAPAEPVRCLPATLVAQHTCLRA